MKSLPDVIAVDVQSPGASSKSAGGVCLVPERPEHSESAGRTSHLAPPPNLIPAHSERIAPEMLTLVALDRQQIDLILQSVPGGAKNVQDIYPLSPLQEGLLFHRLLNEKRDTYVLSTAIALESRAQLDALIGALQKVIGRHDILRSAVLWEALNRPVQVVYRDAVLPVDEITLCRDLDPQVQISERLTPTAYMVDLRRAPLMRLEVAADPHGVQWYAVLHVHHLICDHQSLRLVIAEAMAFLEGRARELPEPVPFRNYVAESLAYARAQDAESFFKSRLGDVAEPTAPFGLLDIHGDGNQIKEAMLELDTELSRRVRAAVQHAGVSAARLFHAAWALVVSNFSDQDDLVFGTVLLAGQEARRGRRMLGMSVNTLPLRLRLVDVTARELVEQTHRELKALRNYAHTSLAEAQRCSGLGGAAPLFTTLLNYRHSASDQDPDSFERTGVRVMARGEAWTNYPISVTVDDLGEGFSLMAKTDRRLDPQRVIAYLQTALASLVDALAQAPHTPVVSLSVMPALERQQVIESFNTTRAPYPREKLIHELFEEHARRAPDAPAVMYRGRSLTYAELNDRANQLARHLRNRGVGPDQLVAICVDRGFEMLIGMLAILKAGGAYVPLDPAYPRQQLAYMLKDAAPKVLLSQRQLIADLPETDAEVIVLDEDRNEIAGSSASNLDAAEVGLRSDHLAYVIYTSGSTGQPKGVMVEHRNVVSLWKSLEHIYRESGDCLRVAVNASFNFDSSVKQFIQLLSGRALVPVPSNVRWDANALLAFLDEYRIDGIDCTPSQLKAWIAAGLLNAGRQTPRLLLVGGEAIDAELWRQLSRCSDSAFYNVYGPTESTVDATAALVSGSTSPPHIGHPIENRRVYILDRHQRPVPIGVTGELYIAGEGVARGYLNRADLTAERFLRDPFVAQRDARMYKTGDLGRWRADGTLEYLGRNDHQVKIRGFRVELGEIEAQLVRHEAVREAVVIAREDVPGDKRVVAYIVPKDAVDAMNIEVLRAHLKAVLPDHMIPAAFIAIAYVPLTPNGKVDRSALPAPNSDSYASQRYEAPEGEVEEFLATTWSKLLGLGRVGRRDNFFELGGHSILAMQVAARVQSALAVELPVRVLFESPTLEQLASRVDDLRGRQLRDRILRGGGDVEELLASVASMPESRVMELLSELGARP